MALFSVLFSLSLLSTFRTRIPCFLFFYDAKLPECWLTLFRSHPRLSVALLISFTIIAATTQSVIIALRTNLEPLLQLSLASSQHSERG